MEFKKYQHVERFGNTEVRDIEIGECLIFPKVDGTNAQVYLDDDGNIKAGSRNRELTLEKDNAGFYAHVLENKNIKRYLKKHPTHRLYGEWLVPHSLRTYRDEAWRRFYIFDVCLDKEDGGVEYIPYNIYQPMLEEFNLDYIPPLAVVKNGSYDQFIHYLDKNNFLIQDGKGNGEGIVIKNYNFINKFGRTTWAKIVTSEFKEKHTKVMGAPVVNNEYMIEEKILNEFCTKAFIEKEFAKLVNEKDGWSNKYIPELFGKVWYELVNEESWNIIKKYKNPTINYKLLNNLMIKKIKEVKSEIFS
jgi:hypothetical protein